MNQLACHPKVKGSIPALGLGSKNDQGDQMIWKKITQFFEK
jgi:hypothetical protein